MLDIRATHYPSPLSEVEFESVPLTVHLINVADETGLISGAFRVYNDTTGLLIFSSDIAPTSLAAGAGVDVSSLTEFDPPAPLDDTYFVIFDGIASNALVPDGIGIHLGAFHFDVKPIAMGPAPAAHAPTHEQSGADPIEPSDLGTSELDTSLRLAPDGAGGVSWVPGTGGLVHSALTGLAADDHTQYRLREQVIVELECMNYTSLTTFLEFFNSATGSGTATNFSLSNHPGVFALSSSATANSGRSVTTSTSTVLVAGGETIDVILRPQVLAGTTIRLGLIDTTTISDCSDGAYFEMAQVGGVDGVIVGKTASNSARSTTATNFTLTTNTWYRFKVVVNSNATRVDFYLYSEAGALLWTDSLTTNIPTGASRDTGVGLVATHAPTSAVLLCDLDYIRLVINRTLVR